MKDIEKLQFARNEYSKIIGQLKAMGLDIEKHRIAITYLGDILDALRAKEGTNV